eukprot:scaffold49840_cov20-Tisochrysis_lutea.AAC.3
MSQGGFVGCFCRLRPVRLPQGVRRADCTDGLIASLSEACKGAHAGKRGSSPLSCLPPLCRESLFAYHKHIDTCMVDQMVHI